MDEEIRPPDKPIRECLLPNYTPTIESEEDQLKRVLAESEIDFEFEYAIFESKQFAKEREERSKHFANFRIKIAQFMRIDKPNESFYSELLLHIDKYEFGGIPSIQVDKEFYTKFRKTLDNMRLNEEDRRRLLEFIKQ